MHRVLALAAAAALMVLPAAGGAAKPDYAAVALNVLPPGAVGRLAVPRTASDQLRLYDGLTPRLSNVRPADLARYFKPERFGVVGTRTLPAGRGGWYGYFVRDLADRSPTFCGRGDYERCQRSLREAVDEAGAQLAAQQGLDPTQVAGRRDP